MERAAEEDETFGFKFHDVFMDVVRVPPCGVRVRGRGGVPPRACDRGVRKPGNWQTANGRENMRGNLK
jgi:hypothetical protein